MISEIYIDESSQTKARFLVLGATVIPQSELARANAAIMMAREPELPHGEMKWTKVSRGKLVAYERVVDCFFRGPGLADAHFHALVVDTSQLDHHRFNQGSKEIGFNKEIYQIANKCARLYPDKLFHLYPDHRDTAQRPEELRTILNHGRKKSGDSREWPFRRCHFRNSKTTPLLWISDLFAGAIAYHLNGHINQENASPAKRALAHRVLQLARVRYPMADTAKSGKFTIWHRRLL